MDLCNLSGFVICSMFAMILSALAVITTSLTGASIASSTGVVIGVLSEIVIIMHLLVGDYPEDLAFVHDDHDD